MARRRRVDPNALALAQDEQAAWEGFLRVHARLTRALDGELERSEGLSLNCYDVLIQLARAPGRRLRMSELAEAVLLSPSGLTRLVERLERDGLVQRVRSSDDGRGACATLTERGRYRVRKATLTHLAGVRRRFLDGLSADERRMLARLWERTLAAEPGEEAGRDERRGRAGRTRATSGRRPSGHGRRRS
jgi:DNA-binding MarR family transcriptional regulator